MLQRFSKLISASGMAAALAAGSLPKPAAADTQSTINTLLGAAAVIGGIILYNNYEHKRQAANTIVGYTRNGGTIYGDGRIVMPNGQTIYPNSNGQYPWGQYAYYNPQGSGYTYDYNRTGQYDNTHRHNLAWARSHRVVQSQVQYVQPQARYVQPQARYQQSNTYTHPQYQQHTQYQHAQTHIVQPQAHNVQPQAHYVQPQAHTMQQQNRGNAQHAHPQPPPNAQGHHDDQGGDHHH